MCVLFYLTYKSVKLDLLVFFLMIRRPPRSTQSRSSAASDVYKRQEYDEGKIKKHELTRQDKEDDRTRHVAYVNAQTGPVFISYRSRSGINEIVQKISAGKPEYDFTADDGVRHTAWVVDQEQQIETIKSEFARVDALYIADGHHRAAAGAAVARQRRREGRPQESDMVLAVFFPHDQLKVMDYNRAVKDLHGLTPEEFKQKIRGRFSVSENFTSRSPERPHDFGMYLSGCLLYTSPSPRDRTRSRMPSSA